MTISYDGCILAKLPEGKGDTINKKFVYKVALLTLIWIVLREEVSLFTVAVGIGVSILCIWYSWKFLPIKTITGVNFFKLILYFFYLIGQIYVSGIYVIKIILKGKARADLVEIKTSIANDTLRVILADSITLTPGSVMLDLTDDNITVMWLRETHEPKHVDNAGDLIKGHLEEKLLKTEKGA